MKEFQDETECPKCGHKSLTCKFNDTDASVGKPEYLSWRCTRCSYYWETEPKTKEVVNGSENRES